MIRRFKRWRVRRAEAAAWAVRDRMNGWWENAAGEWRRDTPHGRTFDGVLDRFAEDYVNHGWSIERLIEQIDKACVRYARLLPGQPGPKGERGLGNDDFIAVLDPANATPLPAPGMTDLMVTPEAIDAALADDGPCPFCGTPADQFDGHICEEVRTPRCYVQCGAGPGPCKVAERCLYLDALPTKDVNTKEEPR